MKRSEMIDYILGEIEDIAKEYIHVNSEEHDRFFTSRANGLLDMIEGFGMVPPDYLKQESCGCCSFYVEHDWESEIE